MTGKRLAYPIVRFALIAIAVLGAGRVHAELPMALEVAAPPAAAAAAPSVPSTSAGSAPPISITLDPLARAWAAPHDLGERAARARRAADDLGIASVDPLAHAILLDAGAVASPRHRAEAAVLIAPALPAAQAALAAAAWESGDVGQAASAAVDAARAIPEHFDGWIWLGVTGSILSMLALAGGGLAFLAARACATGRFLAHDLGDLLEPSMPSFARVAGLAALVLAPAALGEGWVGIALGLFAVCLCAGAREQRLSAAAAALCIVLAVHPVARVAGARVAAVASDAIATATWAAESGVVDAVDAARLSHAGRATAEDPLAVQALAQWARRSGDLVAADARYAALLDDAGPDPVVLNNAASVKLALGDPTGAIELYRRAIAVEPSALLWFNLSQAHGAAIDVEQHDRALAAAQSIDPKKVSELTARLAQAHAPYAAELPLSQARVRDRMLAGDARLAADELRRWLAPGLLGRSIWVALAAFTAVGSLAFALSRRFEASAACPDCGAHQCRRCGATPRGDGRCEPCQRRRFHGRAAAAWEGAGGRSIADRALRVARWTLPGLGGWSGERTLLGVPAAISMAGVFALIVGGEAILPDPVSVGGAADIAFGGLVAVLVAFHLLLAAAQGLRERRSRS